MATPASTGTLIRRRAMRGTVSNYVGSVLTLATSLLLTPFVLHTLGADDYGLWALAASTVGWFALLDLGIGTTVTKYVAEHRARSDPEQARSIVATSLRVYALLGVVTFALSAAVAPVLPHLFNVPPERRWTMTLLVVMMGATAGLSLPGLAATATLRGLHRFDLVTLVGTLTALLGAAATVAALLLDGGVLGMVAATAPVLAASQLLSIWLVRRVAPELRFGWAGASRQVLGTIGSFGAPLFAMNVAGYAKTRTDEAVIGAFLPVGLIAPYVIARKLGELTVFLTDQFLRVVLPLASELDAGGDRARLAQLLTTSTRLTLAIALPIVGTAAILAGPILASWVGAEYAEHAGIVAILALASLVEISLWPAGSVMQGMARLGPLAGVSVAGATASVALSVALVQPLGLTGVALGTLIPLVAEGLFVFPYALRILGVGAGAAVRDIVVPVAIPALPLIAVLVAVRPFAESGPAALALGSGAALAAYAVAYLAVNWGSIERRACQELVTDGLRIARTHLGTTS